MVGTVPVSNRRIDKATASTDHQLPMRRAADDAASKRCRIDIRRRGEQHAATDSSSAPASDWSPSVGASFTALATKVVRGAVVATPSFTLERDAVRAIPVRSWCVSPGAVDVLREAAVLRHGSDCRRERIAIDIAGTGQQIDSRAAVFIERYRAPGRHWYIVLRRNGEHHGCKVGIDATIRAYK